jgi:hypothetical protein
MGEVATHRPVRSTTAVKEDRLTQDERRPSASPASTPSHSRPGAMLPGSQRAALTARSPT